jgi:hypothetical protein
LLDLGGYDLDGLEPCAGEDRQQLQQPLLSWV